MKCSVKLAVGWMALGMATACGGTDEQGLAGASPDAAEVEAGDDGIEASQVLELHAFEYEQTRYTILEVDGELITAFSRPRHAPVPQVVSADGEKLTLLETYLALQPDGVPDQRLLDEHVLATERLGRADDSVHAASVELLATLDKGAAEQEECVTFAAGFTGGTFVAPHYTKSGEIAFINGTFTSARPGFPNGERGDMLLLACNFNAGAQTETVQFQKKTGTGAFITQFTRSIAANNTEGIIQNTGNGVTRFNLRMRVTTTPNVPMVGGVFAEARP